MRHIFFFTDAATDDLFALPLLFSKDVSIAGIFVTGTGLAHGYCGAKNLEAFYYSLGKPVIPIDYGSYEPLDSYGKPFPDWLRTKIDNLLVGVLDISQYPESKIVAPQNHKEDSAIEKMREIIESADPDDKFEIMVTSPLTDVAKFLKKYPHLSASISNIIVMGGAIDVEGNISAIEPTSTNKVAEWNIYADPMAASIVFASGIHITLIPLNATRQVPMTMEFYDALSLETHPSLKILFQLLKEKLDLYGMDFFLNHYALWDVLAGMILLKPSIANIEEIILSVDLSTAQTTRREKYEEGCCKVDVAMVLPKADLILSQYLTEIKKHFFIPIENNAMKFFQSPAGLCSNDLARPSV